MTSWKTSHGPQKSITTAPSEIRKATGIWPLSGGLSDVVSVATSFRFEWLSLTGAPVANNALSASTPSASRKPNRATRQTTSILFIVRAFMIRFSDNLFVAAMTTIIIFLPTGESLIKLFFLRGAEKTLVSGNAIVQDFG
jgi:hypothetical protein